MESRYDEVMKNIEVTTEMRNRILNNISGLDLDKNSNKVIPFPNGKKYLSVVACFVFLLVGAIIVHNTINVPEEPPLLEETGIVDHSTIGKLSEAVGFTMKELHDIPFDVGTVTYTSYWEDLAEVTYTGQNNKAVLRMAPGDEDISGDYSEYADIENFRTDDYDVTIKGNDGKYSLAVWQCDGFSYAVHFAAAVSQQEMLTAVESLQ